jgi:hypothetical protein
MSNLCIFSGSSVPIEIGEMDGRNAGSAVIGFVNGMYIIKYHSSRFPKESFLVYKLHHSLSLSLTHAALQRKNQNKKKTYTETFKKTLE